MNKSDKYYLKQGKLELSMLEDELENSSKTQQVGKKDVFADIEFPHTKRLKDVQSKEPKLKVTQDIYNTLHTMGQFLTKVEEVDDLAAIKLVVPKKTVNSAKVQKLEQIASTLKIQDIALPPRDIKEEDNSFSKEDHQLPQKQEQSAVNSSLEKVETENEEVEFQTKQVVQTVYVPNEQILDGPKRIEDFLGVNKKQEENNEKESNQENSKDEQAENGKKQRDMECTVKNMYSDIANKVESFYKQQSNERVENLFYEQPSFEKELTQSKIDEVIKEYFGEVSEEYAYAKELKKRIDKQIQSIINYE